MRLRMFIGAGRTGQLATLVIDIEMPLAWPVDAIGPVHTGVEPLRRIRRGHLRGKHVAHFIIIGVRIFFGGEIATFPAPIGPGAGKTVEYLLGRCLARVTFLLGKLGKCLVITDGPPQP